MVIVGAGPYGLAVAAHLREAGIEPLVLGEAMGAWRQMPERMFLRSFREASNIGDPRRELTLDRFGAERGRAVPSPVSISDFIEYGLWFQSRAVPEIDGRLVKVLEPGGQGFRLHLFDGDEVQARTVVVAAGIEYFAYMPPELQEIEPTLVSHSSVHSDFAAFENRRLLLIGAGQSALEWGVLAREAGAHVEILARRPLRFLRGERVHDGAGMFRGLLYPSWGVGPPGLNVIMGHPPTYRLLPMRMASTLAYRAIRPAGAAWLRPRLGAVTVTVGASVRALERSGKELKVDLDDGGERRVDHLIAGTGYRIEISRYRFLSQDLLAQIRRLNGSPWLSPSYESSVLGLHFLGAPAAAMMGPGMRFVSHTRHAASAVSRAIVRRS